MAIVTKTLTASITSLNYPVTYSWYSDDCDPNITYDTANGTVNADGNIVTTISYDDTDCLDCMFSLAAASVNTDKCNDLTEKRVSLTCGKVSLFTNSVQSNVLANFYNNTTGSDITNCAVGTTCYYTGLTFGTFNIDVQLTNCNSPLQATITVNGVSQTGVGNAMFNFNVTTSFTTPDIEIDCNCF